MWVRNIPLTTQRRKAHPHTHTHTHTHTYICVCYLWLREHVQTPGAHLAVSGDANQVVGILGANHIHTVHWVLQRQREMLLFCCFKVKYEPNCVSSQAYRMCCCWQGSPLHRGPLVAPVVPQHNLPWVCAPHHNVRVELGKRSRHYSRL